MKDRLKDPNNPFSGYVEVQKWLKDKFGVEIEYQWLWKYMRTKMGTGLKVTRKNHAKKVPKSGEVFFKNAENSKKY